MDEYTKTIAFYLPQFHEIEENDQWWGKGFTEWKHVKKAKPLFKGHIQPKIPYKNNYYDLMDKNIVEWQTDLMIKYGINAFAYYHYWYDGKLLLEKPAENLLTWKDIPQNFIFFWANHTWYKANKGHKSILIEQTYNGMKDWKDHYNYIRSFFKDSRYVKIDNKPVFGIYSANTIPDYDQMICFWNNMAKKDGFSGLYIVESLNEFSTSVSSEYADAAVMRQPNLSMCQEMSGFISIVKKIIKKIKKNKLLKKFDYRKISYNEKNIDVNSFKTLNAELQYCISTGWDNTPRHGKYGQVFVNSNPKLFEDVVYTLYAKSLKENRKLIFINAWNEWAEGMMLEPDEEHGYDYLISFKAGIEKAKSVLIKNGVKNNNR